MSGMKKRDSGMINKSAGAVIRLLRKKKQLSGYEFGQLTGLSQQQISRYERGRNHLTLNLLIKMLIVLDVTLEDFFYQLSIVCGFADTRDMLSVYDKQSITTESTTDDEEEYL